MVAVTIHDLVQGPNGGYLAFDLIDILRLIESDVVASTWRIGWVESTGGAYRIWDGHEFRPEQYSGTDLIRIAETARQIIWGDFEAYRNSEPTPWLVIRAIDSSFWVVISNESRIIEVMKSHFKVVRDSPSEAEYPEESHHSLSD